MTLSDTNFQAVLEGQGRYLLEKFLGRGNWGEVYLARDRKLNRPVALKVPRLVPDHDPEVLFRFDREVLAAAALEHPNICPVFDFAEVDCTFNKDGRPVRVPFVTMAYVEGVLLSERVARGHRLGQREAARLGVTLARALDAAHQKGLVHRDLKAANVKVRPDGTPVLLDFGLVRWTADPARLTLYGLPLGTPAYMAPEQAAGNLDAHGPASDIYALGVVLYEQVAGRLPVAQGAGESLRGYLGRVRTRPPEPPAAHRPDLDPGFGAVLLKVLAKDPAARFAGMAEFAAALAPYAEDRPALPAPAEQVRVKAPAAPAPPPAWPGRPAPWKGKSLPPLAQPPVPVAAGVGTLFLLAVGAVVALQYGLWLLALGLLALVALLLGAAAEHVTRQRRPAARVAPPADLPAAAAPWEEAPRGLDRLAQAQEQALAVVHEQFAALVHYHRQREDDFRRQEQSSLAREEEYGRLRDGLTGLQREVEAAGQARRAHEQLRQAASERQLGVLGEFKATLEQIEARLARHEAEPPPGLEGLREDLRRGEALRRELEGLALARAGELTTARQWLEEAARERDALAAELAGRGRALAECGQEAARLAQELAHARRQKETLIRERIAAERALQGLRPAVAAGRRQLEDVLREKEGLAGRLAASEQERAGAKQGEAAAHRDREAAAAALAEKERALAEMTQTATLLQRELKRKVTGLRRKTRELARARQEATGRRGVRNGPMVVPH